MSEDAYRIDRLLADWREGIAATEAIGGRPDWVRSVTLDDIRRIVAHVDSLRQQVAAGRVFDRCARLAEAGYLKCPIVATQEERNGWERASRAIAMSIRDAMRRGAK